MATTATDDAKVLMKKKDAIEAEMKELMDVLQTQRGVGLDEPLVDAEQFPRADIDVYSVRHARHRIVFLQNDHKAIMKEIEEKLYEVHALARQQQQQQPTTIATSSDSSPDTASIPFATVERVDVGSPAASVGLNVGDAVLQFGSVTSDNFTSLQNIGAAVQHSKDKPMGVVVLRDGKVTRLSLTPRSWEGKGLLGCNILPAKT